MIDIGLTRDPERRPDRAGQGEHKSPMGTRNLFDRVAQGFGCPDQTHGSQGESNRYSNQECKLRRLSENDEEYRENNRPRNVGGSKPGQNRQNYP
jgi:hypothetical protein